MTLDIRAPLLPPQWELETIWRPDSSRVESGLRFFFKTTPLPREVLAYCLSYRFTALLAEKRDKREIGMGRELGRGGGIGASPHPDVRCSTWQC